MTDNFKLNEQDLKVLSIVYHRGKDPLERLASKVKLKPHVFRYSLAKLVDHGLIHLQPFINTYAFGYRQCEIYLEVLSGSSKQIGAFEKLLVEDERVPWVGKYVGRYQYGISLIFREIDEVYKIVDALLKKSKSSVKSYIFSLRRNYIEYPLKIFLKDVDKLEFFLGETEAVTELDSEDHLILKHLTEDPMMSVRDLGEIVGLHHSSVHQRIKRLEENGVVSGWAYQVDFERLGLLNYLFLVKLAVHEKSKKEQLSKFLAENYNVIYSSESLGGWDLKISSLFYQPKEIAQFLGNLHDSFPGLILDIETLTALDYLKVKRYPFSNRLI